MTLNRHWKRAKKFFIRTYHHQLWVCNTRQEELVLRWLLCQILELLGLHFRTDTVYLCVLCICFKSSLIRCSDLVSNKVLFELLYVFFRCKFLRWLYIDRLNHQFLKWSLDKVAYICFHLFWRSVCASAGLFDRAYKPDLGCYHMIGWFNICCKCLSNWQYSHLSDYQCSVHWIRWKLVQSELNVFSN